MSTLTQFEFDRLELALQNSKDYWVASPHKRVLQLAFEEIEELRRAAPSVRRAVKLLRRATHWAALYPKSARARREVMKLCRYALLEIVDSEIILGRVANVNENHV